jgi:prepilin-type N-terminal cleavage/methylation domain-containing protein
MASGFTLVEVLVAIVLIEIGLLALTAASGIVIRQATLARARLAALEIARNRIETLAATPCVALVGSVTPRAGYREQWSSRLLPVATRELRDSVSFIVQRVVGAVVFRTRTTCAP